MKRTWTTITVASLILAWAPSAVADSLGEPKIQYVPGFVMIDGVDARNGNFSVTYPSFQTGDGTPYRRTYNSRSVHRGIFGVGWGSTFETSLVVLDQAHAVVVENGNGALTAYGEWPASVAIETIEARVAQAATEQAARRPGPLRRAFSALRRWLSPEPPTTSLAVSQRGVLASEVCDEAVLVRTGSTWTRTRCDGATQTFRPDGRLIAYTTPGEAAPHLLRWKGDRLDMVRDADGGLISFVYSEGLVRVMNTSRYWITYGLDSRGRNIEVTETDAAPLTFTYDDRSNLTRIGFVDTTHRDITYDDRGRATLVEGRNGEKTTFVYGQDEQGRPRTEVQQVTPGAAATSTTYVFY